jgi:outer membrane scaffolding protein for murein synthesis (MipA/OmpV family)
MRSSRNLLRRLLAGSVVSFALGGNAAAQSANTPPVVTPPFELPFLPSPSGLWTVAIGGQAQSMPSFVGADTHSLGASPIFNIHRAGSADQFRSPIDSPSITLFDLGGFRAGPVVAYVQARTASKFPALNGLNDVSATYEVGGFAEYFPVDWVRARIEVRRGFGGSDGVFADASADVIVPLWQSLTWSGGPRLSFANTAATAPYFSIDQVQSLASGLPVFDAKGGLQGTGAGTQLRYQFTPQWEGHAYVEYERLLDDTAASPLVAQQGSANQVRIGLGASYSFDFRVQ